MKQATRERSIITENVAALMQSKFERSYIRNI